MLNICAKAIPAGFANGFSSLVSRIKKTLFRHFLFEAAALFLSVVLIKKRFVFQLNSSDCSKFIASASHQFGHPRRFQTVKAR